MSRSKYDTNPLDPDVKKTADKVMLSEETSEMSESEDAPTLRMSQEGPAGYPQPPTPDTDRYTGWGPQPTDYAPRQTSAIPQTPYSNRAAHGAGPHYAPPPLYQQPHPQARPADKKGLGIDANIEAALSYLPWVGWILAIVFFLAEPKRNYFARFHALQALTLHVGLWVIRNIGFEIMKAIVDSVGLRPLGVIFRVLDSAIGTAAFLALLYLAWSAFQSKLIRVPTVSDYVEKYVDRW